MPSPFALAYYVNAKALFLALEEIGEAPGAGHEGLRAALAGLRFETPFGGPVSLDANRHAVTSAYIVEVVEGDDDRPEQRTIHVAPEVGQTLGLAREVFLALGPPGRHAPNCAEVAAVAPADHPLLQREEDAAMTGTAPSIVPYLSYEDAPTAIAWLKEASGFTETMVVPGPDDTIAHAQLSFGSGMVMLGSKRDDALALSSPCDLGGVTQSIYVIVEDADAHYARAVLNGAEIVRDLEDTPYSSRDYSARGPEGHLWNFGTYRGRRWGGRDGAGVTPLSRRARPPGW